MNKNGKKAIKVHRAIFLLFLLNANNAEPIIGITRLEKLLFLIRNEVLKDTPMEGNYYSFEPYTYGPFSPYIFDDVQLMEDMGYMSKEELNDGQTKYMITPNGMDKIKNILAKTPDKQLQQIQDKIASIKKDKNSIPLKKLLSYVYQKYPKYITVTKCDRR